MVRTPKSQIEQLENKVAVLEQEIEDIKRSLSDTGEEEVVVLRTISRDQARQEIREFFNSGETLYFSDIARRLRIDLPLVVEICQELQEEGEVGIDANPV